MNYDTKSNSLPSFIQPILTDSSNFLDNQLADACRQLQVARCCREANITKRSGYQPMQVLYLLLLMQWLKESSIAMFCRDSMLSFCQASRDVLYDFLKREDFNWRRLQFLMARKVVQKQDLADDELRAWVLDDTLTARRGKVMEGVSVHFDPVLNQCRPGHQVVHLALSTAKGLFPVDCEFFISKKKVQPIQSHKDGRSRTRLRYRQARDRSKPQLGIAMLKRAVRGGLRAP